MTCPPWAIIFRNSGAPHHDRTRAREIRSNAFRPIIAARSRLRQLHPGCSSLGGASLAARGSVRAHRPARRLTRPQRGCRLFRESRSDLANVRDEVHRHGLAPCVGRRAKSHWPAPHNELPTGPPRGFREGELRAHQKLPKQIVRRIPWPRMYCFTTTHVLGQDASVV